MFAFAVALKAMPMSRSAEKSGLHQGS